MKYMPLKTNNSPQYAQKGGFIATTAIILLTTGSLAFVVATISAAASYSDSIKKREERIQRAMNQRACEETLPLLIAKDYFFAGDVRLDDLGCVVHR